MAETAPSVIILSTESQRFVDRAAVTIAPYILAAFFDMLLNGIVIPQIYFFFTSSKAQAEKSRLRWLVAALTVICAFKSATCMAGLWHLVIANMANPDVARRLGETDWLLFSQPVTTFAIGALAQAFFAHRYYILSGQIWFPVVVATLIVLELVTVIMMTRHVTTDHTLSIDLSATLYWVSVFVTNALITATTCVYFYLTRSKKRRETKNLLGRIALLIFQSALLPTIFAGISVVISQTVPSDNAVNIIFTIMIAKLYAVSVLYTLNSQAALKDVLRASQEASLNAFNFSRGIVGRSAAIHFESGLHQNHNQDVRGEGLHPTVVKLETNYSVSTDAIERK